MISGYFRRDFFLGPTDHEGHAHDLVEHNQLILEVSVVVGINVVDGVPYLFNLSTGEIQERMKQIGLPPAHYRPSAPSSHWR
jgi:hypothetical protein